MKLYTKPGACSMADHIALEWTGAKYDAQVVDQEQMKSPSFLKINPSGQVPVLDDDGWVLTQNAAILNYIADKFPAANLGGDGSAQSRAEVNRSLAWLNADVHPAFHALFGTTAYLKDDAAIQKTKDAAKKKLHEHFETANEQLKGKEYLTGARSIADPYLFVVTQWAKKTGVDLSGLDNLDAFDKRMAADAGVKAVMKAEGIDG